MLLQTLKAFFHATRHISQCLTKPTNLTVCLEKKQISMDPSLVEGLDGGSGIHYSLKI